MLRAVEVRLRYGEEWILRGIDLEVASGGCSVALMGPSGSGKTTLLSVLGGLIPPTSGYVDCDFGSLTSPGVVSWIHQANQGFLRRSAMDNVVLGALSTGGERPCAQMVAEDLLNRMGLENRLNSTFRRLSGGERQRVSVARALAARSAFVLADEPTGSLDQANTDIVLDSLFGQNARDASVVIATHDEAVAMRCDRRLTLVNGSIVERG